MTFSHRQLRDVLGQFATGVCVVTALSPSGEAIGLTVNSFTSVSLEPPLILWCVGDQTACLATFEQTDYFTINILNAQQRHLCDRYANRDTPQLLAEHYRTSHTGGLLLHDALGSLECQVAQRYSGGDHTIIVGEVMTMDLCIHADSEPLVFYAGKYQRTCNI